MSERSEAYANFAEGSFSWEFIERPAFDRALPSAAYIDDVRVLDIGSGSGRVIDYHIRRGAREANITGIEPDEANVKLSGQRFPCATFMTQKVQDAELGVNTFEIVTAQLSLRYLNNDELTQLAQRIRSALGVGGFFSYLMFTLLVMVLVTVSTNTLMKVRAE